MQMKSETFVNTYDKACNEDQTTMLNNCINDLIYQKMNCSLPWTNQTGKEVYNLIVFKYVVTYCFSLGKQQCSTKKHFENFLDVHKEFSNGSVDGYLKEAMCSPMNCEIQTWNQMVSFEESYSDDVIGSFYTEPPTNYSFNYYMRTSEVFNFSIYFKGSKMMYNFLSMIKA